MIDRTDFSLETMWCGPGALAMLAGVPVRVAHEALAAAGDTTYSELTGVHTGDFLAALPTFGLQARRVDLVARYPGLTYGPLLRTYLVMGGWVSDHAVVDRDLNTLHVFTGLEIRAIPPARARLLRATAG